MERKGAKRERGEREGMEGKGEFGGREEERRGNKRRRKVGREKGRGFPRLKSGQIGQYLRVLARGLLSSNGIHLHVLAWHPKMYPPSDLRVELEVFTAFQVPRRLERQGFTWTGYLDMNINSQLTPRLTRH